MTTYFVCTQGYTHPPSETTLAAAKALLAEFVAESKAKARHCFGTVHVEKLDREGMAYEIRANRDPQSALWTRHYIREVA